MRCRGCVSTWPQQLPRLAHEQIALQQAAAGCLRAPRRACPRPQSARRRRRRTAPPPLLPPKCNNADSVRGRNRRAERLRQKAVRPAGRHSMTARPPQLALAAQRRSLHGKQTLLRLRWLQGSLPQLAVAAWRCGLRGVSQLAPAIRQRQVHGGTVCCRAARVRCGAARPESLCACVCACAACPLCECASYSADACCSA